MRTQDVTCLGQPIWGSVRVGDTSVEMSFFNNTGRPGKFPVRASEGG